MNDKTVASLITCEHGGNHVPARYLHLFPDAHLLDSHRGYDPGALAMARLFARRLKSPLVYSRVSRLLVELNRSLHHPSLHHESVRKLVAAERELITQRYYHPYRTQVESHIDDAISAGNNVLHLSMHTFTPELNGVVRTADIGFLYDPSRFAERSFVERWRKLLRQARPDLRLRRNYPYLGTSDGLTTHLRTKFPDPRYAGIEVEVNQAWAQKPAIEWKALLNDLANTCAAARIS